jgi:hypothetical protein
MHDAYHIWQGVFCAPWHNPLMESEKVDQRVAFVTRRSQLDAVDEWRVTQRPIPSRNEAIRRLIDLGLGREPQASQS